MFDDSKVSYEIEVYPEDIPIEGNVMASGDDDYDRQVEESIRANLESGNDWAWCMVRVIARYEGIDCVEGTDHLGCCSYKSEDDFTQPGGYWEDMKDVARAALYAELESIAHVLDNDTP